MSDDFVYRADPPAQLNVVGSLGEFATSQNITGLNIATNGTPVLEDEIKKSPDDAVDRLLGEMKQMTEALEAPIKVCLPLPNPVRLDPMLMAGLFGNLVDAGAKILELDGAAYGLNPELDPSNDGFTLMGLPRPEGFRLAIHMGALSAWDADRLAEVSEELAADRYVFAIDAGDDMSALTRLPKESMAILGFVDPAGGQSNDDILDMIDAAAEIMPLERLALTAKAGFTPEQADNQSAVLKQLIDVSVMFWGFAV